MASSSFLMQFFVRERRHACCVIHLRHPNVSDTLATGGGLIFLGLTDGTVAAYDDVTLGELWKFNVASGFNAPPMTFEVNGKQYVAIATGLGA
jgi:alcohol dehydrogenase (cytochrome c)